MTLIYEVPVSAVVINSTLQLRLNAIPRWIGYITIRGNDLNCLLATLLINQAAL